LLCKVAKRPLRLHALCPLTHFLPSGAGLACLLTQSAQTAPYSLSSFTCTLSKMHNGTSSIDAIPQYKARALKPSSPGFCHLLTLRLWLLVAGLVAVLPSLAHAVDGYNPRPDSGINVMLRQADGKLLVGGHFTKMVGTGGNTIDAANHIARLNADGSIDKSFAPGTDDDVSAIAIQADGKILLGGKFKKASATGSSTTTDHKFLVRLKADGSVDEAFAPALSHSQMSSGRITSIVVQADKKIIVGGFFDTVQGSGSTSSVKRLNLARLNEDGSLDSSFMVDTNDVVLAMAQQKDGKVIIAGGFNSITTASSTEAIDRRRLLRLNSDGSLDTGFDPAATNIVYSISLQQDGKILLGGLFSGFQPNGTTDVLPSRFVGRLNPDGTVDSSFSVEASAAVHVVHVQDDGKILLGGRFSQLFSSKRTGLVETRYVGRLNADGSPDESFSCESSQYVTALATQQDGKILAGGWFSSMNISAPSQVGVIPFLARLYPNGSVDTDWTLAAKSTGFTTAAQQADGKLLVAGSFGSLGGVTAKGLARLQTDGQVDTSFTCSVNGRIDQILLLSDGRILIVGSFTSVNDELRKNLAVLNANGSLVAGISAEFSADVNAAAVQSDGKILVGGSFTTINGVSRQYFARLNADGSVDTTFAPHANDVVNSIRVLSTGKIVIVGSFGSINPNFKEQYTRSSIALINADGTVDGSFYPSFSDYIASVDVQSDGKLLLGGAFLKFSTTQSDKAIDQACIARIDIKGENDTKFVAKANGVVRYVKQLSDGKVLVAGEFTQINSTACQYVARLNSDGSLDTSFKSYPNAIVESLVPQTNGKILMVGGFTSIGQATSTPAAPSQGLTRLDSTGAVDASFNIAAPASALGKANVAITTKDGSMLLGGQFSSFAGSDGSNLARFSPNGSVDNSFNVTSNGAVNSVIELSNIYKSSVFANRFAWLNENGTVRLGASRLNFTDTSALIRSIISLPSGKVLLGGRFAIKGSTKTVNNLARLNADGTLDESFTPEPDNMVATMALQSDGKILVAGSYSSIASHLVKYLVRLNPDGSYDDNFPVLLDSTVDTIYVERSGKIIISGAFTKFNPDSTAPIERNFLARLNPDGTVDTTFDPNPNNTVYVIKEQSDGKILLGGVFTGLTPAKGSTSYTRSYIARLNADTSVDTTFDPAMNGMVIGMDIQSDGKILIGGDFSSATPNSATTAITRYGMMRLNTDGTVDTSLNLDPNSRVIQIIANADGSMYVLGWFSKIGGVNQKYVAKVSASGVVDTSVSPDANDSILTMALGSDKSILLGGDFSIADTESQVLAAGEFTTISGENKNYVALLSRIGQALDHFNLSPNGPVNAMTRQDSRNIIAGGAFTKVSGKDIANIVRFDVDGVLDESFKPNADGAITSLFCQPDGKVLVAGAFSKIAGANRQGIARLNADGSIDSAFNPGVVGTIYSLMLDEQGRILVGGSFSNIAGSGKSRLARLSKDGLIDASFSVSVDATVKSINTMIGGKIFIGGSFTQVGTLSRSRFAALDASGKVLDLGMEGADQDVNSIASTADGKVILAGAFSKVDGKNRWLATRIPIVSLVKQSASLNAAMNTLTWVREEGNPLIGQVQAHYSTDDLNWTPVGTVAYSADSKTITVSGLSLPSKTTFFLKLVGYISVSQGGSSSQFEKTWSVYASPLSVADSSYQSIAIGSNAGFGGVEARDGMVFSSSDLPPGLSVDPLTGRIYGKPNALGNYQSRVSYSDGFISGSYLLNVFVRPNSAPEIPGANPQKLIAYSTRASTSAANPLIIGFIVRGSSEMPVLLRALGPHLSTLTNPIIVNALQKPKAALYDLSGSAPVKVLELEGWTDADGSLAKETARVGAGPLDPGSKDVAIITKLKPGAYTWVVSASGSEVGTVLAEVYEANPVGATNPSRLSNCSTRGLMIGSADRMIAGYVLDGDSSSKAILRAMGPSLPSWVGKLIKDPRSYLHLADGRVLAANENWSEQKALSGGWVVGSMSELAAASASMGISSLPDSSKDSAFLVTMPPGIYTYEVASNDNDDGTVLIEVHLQ
jgi:uncharacterized delta-60 repeat protein